MDPDSQDVLGNSWWSSLCSQTMRQIAQLERQCRPEFRPLLGIVGRKFIELPPPKTGADQDRRMAQANLVAQLVQCIAHASSMTKQHPGAQTEVFAAALKLAENDLPGTQDGYRLVSGRCSRFPATLQSILARA